MNILLLLCHAYVEIGTKYIVEKCRDNIFNYINYIFPAMGKKL